MYLVYIIDKNKWFCGFNVCCDVILNANIKYAKKYKKIPYSVLVDLSDLGYSVVVLRWSQEWGNK